MVDFSYRVYSSSPTDVLPTEVFTLFTMLTYSPAEKKETENDISNDYLTRNNIVWLHFLQYAEYRAFVTQTTSGMAVIFSTRGFRSSGLWDEVTKLTISSGRPVLTSL